MHAGDFWRYVAIINFLVWGCPWYCNNYYKSYMIQKYTEYKVHVAMRCSYK